MLTKQDLTQIQYVVQTETRKIVREEIKPLITDVSTLKTDVSTLKKDMSTVKEDISQIRKDMKMIVSFFDREYLELRKRIERIELHLSLPNPS